MNLIGIGLYRYQEASALTKIPVRNLRRWLEGYSYRIRSRNEKVSVAPLWDREAKGETDCMTFRDLLDVRYVQVFRDHDVAMEVIRAARRLAREAFDNPYPFATQRFLNEGWSILASAMDETGHTKSRPLIETEAAFRSMIEPLYAGIVFDENDRATLWYPDEPDRRVVIDPQRKFGSPIVTSEAIATWVLASSYRVERDMNLVALIYEVPLAAVEAAVGFEARYFS
jgi:uncharacterized protein (DUF433 family)